MQGMHEIRKVTSPDLLTYKKILNQCECRFESSATPEDSMRRALPAVMKHWEKLGTVELWHCTMYTAAIVRFEALILQVVDA
jgi:hypothetical protein